MAAVTKKINVSCQLTEAWEVLSAFGEISAWATNVSHSCLLSHQKELTMYSIFTVEQEQSFLMLLN